MRRLVVIATIAAIATVAAIAAAEASTKFSYTEEITSNDLVLNFEEASLKRFASVDYQLEATALLRWVDCGGQSLVVVYEASDTVALTPDDKGRVVGTITLESEDGGFLCAAQHAEYTGVTLTNLTTGHVYRLNSISRDSP
jgi:hypothetical protein